MDLTFQVPMQYCSLQHQTLLSPPDIFTTFCIGPASSFFLELFVTILCYSPVAYWTPSNLGGSSSSVISSSFSYCSWGSPGKNAGVDCHFLLQWTTICQNGPMTICLGWPCTAWSIASLNYTIPSPWQDCDPCRQILSVKDSKYFKICRLLTQLLKSAVTVWKQPYATHKQMNMIMFQ